MQTINQAVSQRVETAYRPCFELLRRLEREYPPAPCPTPSLPPSRLQLEPGSAKWNCKVTSGSPLNRDLFQTCHPGDTGVRMGRWQEEESAEA